MTGSIGRGFIKGLVLGACFFCMGKSGFSVDLDDDTGAGALASCFP
jgi:hypothetical protein